MVIADAYHGLERHGRPGMPARTSKENPLLSKSNAMVAFIHIKASDFIVITPPTTAVNVNEGTSDGDSVAFCLGKMLGQVETFIEDSIERGSATIGSQHRARLSTIGRDSVVEQAH